MIKFTDIGANAAPVEKEMEINTFKTYIKEAIDKQGKVLQVNGKQYFDPTILSDAELLDAEYIILTTQMIGG